MERITDMYNITTHMYLNKSGKPFPKFRMENIIYPHPPPHLECSLETRVNKTKMKYNI